MLPCIISSVLNSAHLHSSDSDESEPLDWSTLLPSILTSSIVHIALVLGMALWSIQQLSTVNKHSLVISPDTTPEVVEYRNEMTLPDLKKEQANDPPVEFLPAELANVQQLPSEATQPHPEQLPTFTSPDIFDIGEHLTTLGPLGNSGPGTSTSGITNRRISRSKAMGHGVTPGSELAVERALKWFASVQARDGSWNFDTRTINPAVTNPGSADQARNGATGLVLLTFLAAGYTHKDKSQYQAVVYRGLEFLLQNTDKQHTKGNDVSWHEIQGTMYSHGIATMAICEAYGMTKDKSLLPFAQGGVNFIATAQDPARGGWRYEPRQPGDTSVVGWQLMALKSGAMAYLTINPATIKQSTVFLNSVSKESEYHAFYGYQNPGRGPAQTAIGLLCRIHLGWQKQDQGLIDGVQFLSQTGPSKTNVYYNYYATQVLNQWGGEEFTKWNNVLREQLIASQSDQGADAGSWFTGNDFSSEKGGRLYCTALNTLNLEVKYRYGNALSNRAAIEPFPL